MTNQHPTEFREEELKDILTQYTLLGQYREQMQQFLPSIHPEAVSPEEGRPFLSVIVRTQGKRFEMLKEALLCLEAQTDDDFEILLIVHNADETGKASVDRLLEILDPAFRQKIHRENLNGGTRTAPLNLGASLARGTHFAMLDDDDLLFDHWVENFHQAARKNMHRVIRCYGCTQAWKTVETPDGLRLVSDGSIRNQYCSPFRLVEHLEDNFTPISCVAIPSFCYHVLGITFDDTLTTAEDWDYIMRCVLTVGICDTKQITFLYRLWNTADSSRSLHSQKEWSHNRRTIYKKLNSIPIVTDRETLIARPNIPAVPTAAPETVLSAPLPDPQQRYMIPYSFRMTCRQVLFTLKNFLRCRLRVNKHARILRESELFDEAWYLDTYEDVRENGLDPVKHYLIYGWHEMRDPSPDFSTRHYLALYPDVREAFICPLLHYELSGKGEKRPIN